MTVILAIDGGGSRTRCLAIDQHGRVVGASESGPSNHLQVSRELAVRSLQQATANALAERALSLEQVICVSAGMAGVDYDGTGAPEMEAVFREIGFNRSLITGDMVIAHAGALGGRPGILALAGTGSCILGIGPDGKRVKVGGWGPVYGDEGSAYRIGQTALRVAARAYDGRGPHTGLVDALLSALDHTDFRGTLASVYGARMEPRQIAALSRVANDVAEAGDEPARAILIQAGEDLAEGVVAAINQLSMSENAPLVSHQGSVFERSSLVRERFTEVLKNTVTGVTVMAPQFEPVIGAVLIGCDSVGWKLDEFALKDLASKVNHQIVTTTGPGH